jgi:hypothetical protein
MCAVAAATVVGVTCFVAPARAQVPAPPEQAAPVFEVIAPTVSPVCGNALLVLALAPGLVAGQTGGALPIEVIAPAFGPVFVVCGAVPAPPARLRCDADNSLNETANAVAGAVAGTQLPVGADPFGSTVEQTIVLQDTLPPPANTTGALDQVVTTLNCKAVAAPVAAKEPADESAPADETSDESVLGDELALAPLLDTLTPDLSAPAAAPARNPSLQAAPAVAIGGSGFHYPIVFALPLLLLALGGYLGRSLTQPVGPPHRRVPALVDRTTHEPPALAKVET